MRLTPLSMWFFCRYYCMKPSSNSPKAVFKYLMRQCEKLPEGPQQHYKFQIKQSYKQYKDETDPEKIQELILRSYHDIDWIMKKYLMK